MAGKGCRYRPVDREKYRENYERIFGKEEIPNVSEEARKELEALRENLGVRPTPDSPPTDHPQPLP